MLIFNKNVYFFKLCLKASATRSGMWVRRVKWLLRALHTSAGMKHKKKQHVKPFMPQMCWQSGGVFIFQQSALTHCAPPQPLLLPVWCVRSCRVFLSLLSFQGNMCAGILPQLRQGLAGSTVGTGRVWESRTLVPSLLPSPTLSLILIRFCSSGCLPPNVLTRTVLRSSFYFVTFHTFVSYLIHVFNIAFLRLYLLKWEIKHLFPHHCVSVFVPLLWSHPESLWFLEVFWSTQPFCGPPLSPVLPLPLKASPAFTLTACLERHWGHLHEQSQPVRLKEGVKRQVSQKADSLDWHFCNCLAYKT